MIRPPEERMEELPAVRASVQQKVQRNRRGVRRAAGKRKNKWASKFQRRQQNRDQKQWRAELTKHAGDTARLIQSIKPKASKSKRDEAARKRDARKRKFWGQTGSRGRPSKAAKVEAEASISFQALADHALLGQEVRVISARTHASHFARKGQVAEATLRKMSSQDAGQVLLKLVFSTLSSESIWIPAVEVQATSQEHGQCPPSPYRIDYQHFRLPSKNAIRTSLSCGPEAQTLDPSTWGSSLEACTVHAGMLEIQTRLKIEDWFIMSPSTSTVLSQPDSAQDFMRGSGLEEFRKTQMAIQDSLVMSIPVWANAYFLDQDADPETRNTRAGHYTYLHGQRSSKDSPWSFTYIDSLAAEAKSCYQAATCVARMVEVLPPGVALPHSSPGEQTDDWSCGLWTLQALESSMRAYKNEVIARPPSIQQIHHRLNEFVLKLKPAPQPVPKGKAKAKAKARAAPVQHATLADALQAGLSCTKCRATKLGQKGCTKCMGTWFYTFRQHGTQKAGASSPRSLLIAVHMHVCIVCT